MWAQGAVTVAEAAIDAAVDLAGQAVNAVDEAAASASFDARADAVRAGADGERMPDARSETGQQLGNDAPSGDEWQDGDPLPADEPVGTAEERPANPWLNLGRPSADVGTGGPDGPDDPDDPGAAAAADDPDPDPDDDGGTRGDNPWLNLDRPPGSANPTDAPDTYSKELKIRGLELEPDVDRMRAANMAKAVEAQQAYEASPETPQQAGLDQDRGARPETGSRATEAARAADIAAQGFTSIRDVNRADVNHVRNVPDVTPRLTQDLRQNLEQRRGLGLGKDLSL
ncbi:hypothetical protein [Streptomyces erythrochromogenes]|uniref:hypothetical protein n=1 Tax=Streptomyces erythrochromogenes TaxID=285574 RepID=UPI003405C33F